MLVKAYNDVANAYNALTEEQKKATSEGYGRKPPAVAGTHSRRQRMS